MIVDFQWLGDMWHCVPSHSSHAKLVHWTP